MTVPENFTLKNAKEKAQTKVFRASDFLTKEEQDDLKKANIKGKQDNRPFDSLDAYMAEIMARFGYAAYQAWQSGDFPAEKMARLIMAERAREKRKLLGLEAIVISATAGANNPVNGGHMPKTYRNAIKIFKSEQEQAKGVK